jgi:sugar phosphate isomerase/epimerase
MKMLRLLLLASLSGLRLLAEPSADFHGPMGLQLWSLNTEFGKGVPDTLDRVKAWGFAEVETAGTGSLPVAQFRAELDKRGLSAVAAHVQYEALSADVAAVIREVQALGAPVAFCAWIPHSGPFTPELATEVAARFNKWGAAFRAAGLRLGYHTHGYEFVPSATAGLTLFDDFVGALDPESIVLEMDVFWVVHAGQDPVVLLNRYPTRWVALHVKDIRKGAPTGLTTGGAPATDKVAVGAGAIDWPAVLGTAQRLGVRSYFIEDESPEPVANIPRSLGYLQHLSMQD